MLKTINQDFIALAPNSCLQLAYIYVTVRRDYNGSEIHDLSMPDSRVLPVPVFRARDSRLQIQWGRSCLFLVPKLLFVNICLFFSSCFWIARIERNCFQYGYISILWNFLRTCFVYTSFILWFIYTQPFTSRLFC